MDKSASARVVTYPKVVHIRADPNEKPSASGRVHWWLFWRSDTAPSGVHGQHFHVRPDSPTIRASTPLELADGEDMLAAAKRVLGVGR